MGLNNVVTFMKAYNYGHHPENLDCLNIRKPWSPENILSPSETSRYKWVIKVLISKIIRGAVQSFCEIRYL